MFTSYLKFLERFNIDTKYVYHIVDFSRLKFIYDNNAIKGRNYATISFTKYKDMDGYLGDSPQSFYKLQFDLSKLKADYEMEDFNYKSANGQEFDEGEIRSKTAISNPFKYVSAIIINYYFIMKFYNEYKYDAFKIFLNDYEYNIKNQFRFIQKLSEKYNIPLLDNSTFSVNNQLFNDILNLKFYDIEKKQVTCLYGNLYDKRNNYEYKEFIIIADQIYFNTIGDMKITKDINDHPDSPKYLKLLDGGVTKINMENVPINRHIDYIRGYETEDYIFSSLNPLRMSIFHNKETDEYTLKYY